MSLIESSKVAKRPRKTATRSKESLQLEVGEDSSERGWGGVVVVDLTREDICTLCTHTMVCNFQMAPTIGQYMCVTCHCDPSVMQYSGELRYGRITMAGDT